MSPWKLKSRTVFSFLRRGNRPVNHCLLRTVLKVLEPAYAEVIPVRTCAYCIVSPAYAKFLPPRTCLRRLLFVSFYPRKASISAHLSPLSSFYPWETGCSYIVHAGVASARVKLLKPSACERLFFFAYCSAWHSSCRRKLSFWYFQSRSIVSTARNYLYRASFTLTTFLPRETVSLSATE